ncbi:alpha/beta hydrolase fold domain-containing protein [Hominifimenecus sp. rT4P-3]|uniref:alpha/beta hydrolase fold domain-containing protein n=1 Tax=Hominifimenecus sp. rT4P-3 TaxID=3242979 RepID=UPI003DA2959C
MDIFLPEDGAGPYPLVVVVHGGGWISGGRREACISSMFKIVSQGYAVATVDYRLAPDGQWPLQVHDVKAAIRFLRAHREKYRLNTERIVLWGNSAGAYLVQLVAATCRGHQIEDLSMGNPNESCQVDGMISWYGVSNLATQDLDMTEICGHSVHMHGGSMESPACQMLGCVIEENPERAVEASSIRYIAGDFVPSLIQHGTGDRLVSYRQSERLYQKIVEECGLERATLELFEGAEHGDARFKTDENIDRCIDFLDEIFWPDGRLTPRTPLPEIYLMEGEDAHRDLFEAKGEQDREFQNKFQFRREK